jgi:hypothetical protein
MKWKYLCKKSIGSSHLRLGKPCEDFISCELINLDNSEVLVCCISDGAGSAKYASEAASLVTKTTILQLKKLVSDNIEINTGLIIGLAESLYDNLQIQASALNVNLNEFSCTYLGCVLYETNSILFQIGDGLIIREDNCGNYTSIWLPENGEYSNTTTFLIDDPFFGNLRIMELNQPINEIAITTDGLQTLILNNQTNSIHQPFFLELFKWIRLANTQEKINELGEKLEEYLSSQIINSRTDDDKTLFLATRFSK